MEQYEEWLRRLMSLAASKTAVSFWETLYNRKILLSQIAEELTLRYDLSFLYLWTFEFPKGSCQFAFWSAMKENIINKYICLEWVQKLKTKNIAEKMVVTGITFPK